MDDCIFCQIAKGTKECHKIWENDEFLAFLSIFPNTDGFTVLISKEHHNSYVFDLSDDILIKIMLAAKHVAKLLDTKLDDVGRTGCVLEGFGINHLHVKLIPMHKTSSVAKWEPQMAYVEKFFDKYEGYLSTHEYTRAEDKHLEKLARKIREKN